MQSDCHPRDLALSAAADGPGARGGKWGLEVWRPGREDDRGPCPYLVLVMVCVICIYLERLLSLKLQRQGSRGDGSAVKVLAALLDYQGLITSIQVRRLTTTWNSNSRVAGAVFWPPWAVSMVAGAVLWPPWAVSRVADDVFWPPWPFPSKRKHKNGMEESGPNVKCAKTVVFWWEHWRLGGQQSPSPFSLFPSLPSLSLLRCKFPRVHRKVLPHPTNSLSTFNNHQLNASTN